MDADWFVVINYSSVKPSVIFIRTTNNYDDHGGLPNYNVRKLSSAKKMNKFQIFN